MPEQYELVPELEQTLQPGDRYQLFSESGYSIPATSPSVSSAERKTESYIKWVQTALNKILGINLAVDGKIGTATRSAIRSFQKQRGLAVDGIVGAQTERALGTALGEMFTSLPGALYNTTTPCETIDNFEFGKSEVRSIHEPTLIKIAQAITNSQSTSSPIKSIDITGHTDKVGNDGYNIGLGQRRGDTVKNYLTQAIERLSPGLSRVITIKATSKGETEAIFPVAFKNRRVVICYSQTTVQPPAPTLPAPTAPVITCSSPFISPGPTAPIPVSISAIITAANAIVSNPVLQMLAGYQPPTRGRFLDADEITEAKKVFVDSLDFSKIIITDGGGINGSYFTLAVPVSGVTYIVIMLRSVCSWVRGENSRKTNVLIHELTHAWQSQHHSSNRQAFMFNSVTSQAGAIAYKLLLAQSQSPISIFFPSIDVSAYAYVPNRSFDQYGAEQIAQQVEDDYIIRFFKYPNANGVLNPKITKEIQSVGLYGRSILNEKSMGVITFERDDTPGVKFR